MKPFLIPFVYRCNLIKVVDGDTVDVMIDLGFNTWMYERVRLGTIDTPEIRTPEGVDARNFTRDWCLRASQILLVSLKYDAREKYGRVLGDLFSQLRDGATDPISLGQALINAGYSKVVPQKS